MLKEIGLLLGQEVCYLSGESILFSSINDNGYVGNDQVLGRKEPWNCWGEPACNHGSAPAVSGRSNDIIITHWASGRSPVPPWRSNAS
ncbi:hypothetical protein VN97_g336 [Penicillium thymicola]|uniref:Uncharacterized protein n=1 Tax=Penicillium thymicola TaxID=293382 RepID=A0AAI9XDT1_PENTH|nr:hypothetical protein VN97_g336 [Penicillium thymicola]